MGTTILDKHMNASGWQKYRWRLSPAVNLDDGSTTIG